jgi:hypothetical protein
VLVLDEFWYDALYGMSESGASDMWTDHIEKHPEDEKRAQKMGLWDGEEFAYGSGAFLEKFLPPEVEAIMFPSFREDRGGNAESEMAITRSGMAVLDKCIEYIYVNGEEFSSVEEAKASLKFVGENPPVPLLSKWPIIKIDWLYHVGLLNPKAKGKQSLEGAGLSVSVHPGTWVRIAQLGGLPWWKLSKKDGMFLNYHAMSNKHRALISQWGVESAFVQRGTSYEVSRLDGESGERSFMLFDDKTEAEYEFNSIDTDEKPQIGPVSSLYPTQKMKERVAVRTDPMLARDHLATIFAEDVLGVDGVWWEDNLDEEHLSAPRGVIVLSMVKTWTAREVEPDEDGE